MKPRRPRMTPELVERLIAYAGLAEAEYDCTYGWDDPSEDARAERRKAKRAEKDKAWLFRMRDWFDRKDG